MGEEPAGAACRARQARVLLVAADAADNSIRRAARFAEAGQIPWLKTPWDKGTLGGAVGRTACAMLALTDAGLAAALVEKLAQADPDAYGPAAEALRDKADSSSSASGSSGPMRRSWSGQRKSPGAPARRARRAEKPGPRQEEKEDAMRRREYVCNDVGLFQ